MSQNSDGAVLSLSSDCVKNCCSVQATAIKGGYYLHPFLPPRQEKYASCGYSYNSQKIISISSGMDINNVEVIISLTNYSQFL
ncbi:MAG: hypothetical protein VKN72_06245 [Nostocales cyanobacterium 94392]|nr:hypothetical protein [Nostocales cyanobacterium 94392]